MDNPFQPVAKQSQNLGQRGMYAYPYHQQKTTPVFYTNIVNIREELTM